MRGPRRMVVVVSVLLVAVGACGGGGTKDRITADDLNPPPSRLPAAASTTAPTTTPTTAASASKWRKSRVDPSLPRQDIDVKVLYPATFTRQQADVVRAFANYRHVFFATLDPPDPTSPLFARFGTPNVVDINRQQRQDMVDQGVRGPVIKNSKMVHVVISAAIKDGHATLTVCQVDDSIQVDKAGAVVDNRVVTSRVTSRLSKGRSGWIVGPERGATVREWPGSEVRRCTAG